MLTQEQVLSLAPDPSAAKAGRDLASRRKWLSIGRFKEFAVWGECQGSGASPYQTQVDLSEPAFKCTCPSRKFPCKHGLGLLLLFAAEAGSFSDVEPPDWVVKWLADRAERADKIIAKHALPTAEESAETELAKQQAREKRAAQREQRILDGLDDLDRWLGDLVRRGIANVDLGYKLWDSMAARLVDSQAPGLARMVRRMAGIPSSGHGWQERLAYRLGLLHLASVGYRRAASLSETVRADLRTVVGWTISSDEISARPGVADRWAVIGQTVETEDRLHVRRTWLQGWQSARPALVLEFAPEHLSLPAAALIPGAAFDGELAFFESELPLRSMVKAHEGNWTEIDSLRAHAEFEGLLAEYASAMGRFPWVEDYPLAIENAVLADEGEKLFVVDIQGNELPVDPGFLDRWRLLAVTGGRESTLCGLWNGEALRPLGVHIDGRYEVLA